MAKFNPKIDLTKNILLGISISIVTFIIMLPIYWMAITAFKTPEEAYRLPITYFPVNPTLENVIKIFSEEKYLRFFLNSWLVSLSVVTITISLASFAGYGFSRLSFHRSQVALLSMLIPQMIAPIVLIIPLFILMKGLRLYNTYLSLILAISAYVLPFSIWMLTGFFQTIPTSIEEAALIDGCSRIQCFLKIVVPLSKPGIVAIAIYSFIIAWNDYLFCLTLTGSEKMRTMPVAVAALKGQYEVHWTLIMTLLILITIPVIILFIFLQRYLVQGLTRGAVK